MRGPTPTGATSPARLRARAAIASGLIGVLAVGALSGTAVAQEEDAEPLEILDIAFYAAPVTDSVPNTLRTGVPPAAVCVVANDLCPDSTREVRDSLSDGFNAALDEGRPEPVHAVPADTLAVSVLGGVDRYLSAARFELPSIPSGEEFVNLTVRFPVEQPTYDANSPAFRRLVLAVFETISTRDPQTFASGLAAALQESPIEVDEQIMTIEVCPLTEPFEPGGPPTAQSADEDLPRDDAGEPAVDCVLGSGSQFDPESGTYSFDLTFAAQAWAEGAIENHGILLRPSGIQNLAFGDADTSTTAQIVLGTEDVEIVAASAPPPPPPEPIEPLGDLGGDDFGDDDFGGDDFGDGSAELDGFDGGDAGGFDPGPAMGGPSDLAGPEIADGGLDEAAAGDPQAAGPGDQAILDTVPARGGMQNPWWLWLLVPLFGGGGYIVAQPLLAPTAAAGVGKPGALSRLLERAGGPGSAPVAL
jgi:hypothetical protein